MASKNQEQKLTCYKYFQHNNCLVSDRALMYIEIQFIWTSVYIGAYKVRLTTGTERVEPQWKTYKGLKRITHTDLPN